MFETIIAIIVGLVFLKIVKPKAHTNLMNSAETAIDAVSETAECASTSLHLANNGLKKSLVELNQSLEFDNQEWLKLKENLYQTNKVRMKTTNEEILYEKRYTLAFFIGILAGIFGAIVKWGWEVPFPPRNPNIPWPVDAAERVTPPKIFLEQLGLNTDLTYVFSGVELPLSIFIVHVGFSIIFGVMYCMLVEKYPIVKMWQGAVFGFFVYVFAHVIVMPLISEVPPLSQIPFDEHLSEFLGHIVWLWGIEIVRHDLKNRIVRLRNKD